MRVVRKKIFITVKTYPNPSASYVETVCTAGIVENEGWIRLYPVPYRVSSGLKDKRFKKYQWITVDVVKRSSPDNRPESHSPQNGTLEMGDFIQPKSDLRKEIIFNHTQTYTKLKEIIALAADNKISLATFKPTEILKFYYKPCKEKTWTKEEQAKLDKEISAGDFFLTEQISRSNLTKVPFVFKFKFKDADGKESNMMIEDWEVGALFWNAKKIGDPDERTDEEAAQIVIDKYNKICAEQDCYFFLGTTNKFHNMGAPNPFVIIGFFHAVKDNQTLLPF